MTGRLCVVGSFMMDLVVRAPRRPLAGETIVGHGFDMFLGGKGFNQAVAAARCGATTAMVGRLGDDDFGRRFRECLAIEGIDDTHVAVDAAAGTGIGAPLVETGGENSIVVIPRANAALSPVHIEAAAPAITSATVLLLQLELPVVTAVAAARLARDAGVTVVLNPAPALAAVDMAPLRGLVDVLVPNETEAMMLAGAVTNGDGSVGLAATLRRWSGAAVVLTAGGAGCVLADGEGTESVASHPVDVVDTVGAGDAFCGVLGAWLADGSSLREAVRHANAAGALAVTRAGAEPSMPRRDDVVALVAGRSTGSPTAT
jgi:ribokinase